MAKPRQEFLKGTVIARPAFDVGYATWSRLYRPAKKGGMLAEVRLDSVVNVAERWCCDFWG